MKIQVTTSSFGKAGSKPVKYLKQNDVELRINPLGRTLTEDEAIEIISDADGLIAGTEPLTRRVIESLQNLKVISRCGAGLDNVDIEAAESRNIKVFNTPGIHVQAVAELALVGILSCQRNIVKGDRVVRRARWEKFMGKSLFGKTVGIIGFGSVGKKLATLLKPFDATILVYDPYLNQVDFGDEKLLQVDLNRLLTESEIISLHVPYTEETHHMLDEKRFEQMKPDATIVNTARGGVIDEKALTQYLEINNNARAFLDVFSVEPYRGALAKLENIILSPHIGARTQQAREEMEFQAAKNLMEAITQYVK